MTMPIPEFHPHSTSDLYLASYGLQRSGRDGPVVGKIQELLGKTTREHIPVEELPLLDSNESVLVFAGLRFVLDMSDGDPEALAAAETLLEEQLDPLSVIRHDEEMRARAEEIRSQGQAQTTDPTGELVTKPQTLPSLSIAPSDFYALVGRMVEIAERRESYIDCSTGELPTVA